MTPLERLYNIAKYLWFRPRMIDHDPNFYADGACITIQGNWVYNVSNAKPGGFMMEMLPEHFPEILPRIPYSLIPSELFYSFNTSRIHMYITLPDGVKREFWVDLTSCVPCVERLIQGLLPDIEARVDAQVKEELFRHLRQEKLRQLGITE